ncbi:hypothetical protein CEXT_64731 [Caerostris extrusa]|uniref:Uncharacterized protein n=1 Tax=Caerostris extrusa TaxID=172846 RepID=A0AAV4RLK5_CAEEX|nr:hypothetical protein CEXT_64731 [Caerostris extrusa]
MGARLATAATGMNHKVNGRDEHGHCMAHTFICTLELQLIKNQQWEDNFKSQTSAGILLPYGLMAVGAHFPEMPF